MKHARDCYLPPRIEEAIEEAERESQKHADLAKALLDVLDEKTPKPQPDPSCEKCGGTGRINVQGWAWRDGDPTFRPCACLEVRDAA